MYERLEAEGQMMKVEIWPFELGYSHGEGGGAEDLLVVHLVLGDEQANCRLRQFLEGHPQGSLGLPFGLEASHQGVQGGTVGVGPGLDARGGVGHLFFFIAIVFLSFFFSNKSDGTKNNVNDCWQNF